MPIKIFGTKRKKRRMRNLKGRSKLGVSFNIIYQRANVIDRVKIFMSQYDIPKSLLSTMTLSVDNTAHIEHCGRKKKEE